MKRTTIFYAFLLLVCCSYCANVRAQDPHFSQYFTSPMTLNPALIGNGVEDWRAMANFRSQWWGGGIAPYQTISASIEKAWQPGASKKNVFAMGLSLLSDESNSGLLKNTFFTVGSSYHISLDAQGDEMLSLGFEATYANRLVDASKFQFQSQFESMGFQRSVPSGDPVNITSNNYLDVNAGIQFSKNIPGKWGYHIGAAIFHITTPSEGVYSNNTYSIDRRVSLQAGTVFYLSNKNEIHTSFTTDMQGDNQVYTLGAVYKAKLGSSDKSIESVNLGLWNRFADAMYPYIGIEGKKWLIGISYDVVTSDVKTTSNSVQSMEFSLVWHLGGKKNTDTHSASSFTY